MQNGHNTGTEPCGVIVMDKHEGVSSFRMIQILRKMFDTKKVGHTGTLDPLATGVLPVLVGRAVKASEYIMSEDKEYSAVMRLGIETDTEDITGNVIRSDSAIPERMRCTASARVFAARSVRYRRCTRRSGRTDAASTR